MWSGFVISPGITDLQRARSAITPYAYDTVTPRPRICLAGCRCPVSCDWIWFVTEMRRVTSYLKLYLNGHHDETQTHDRDSISTPSRPRRQCHPHASPRSPPGSLTIPSSRTQGCLHFAFWTPVYCRHRCSSHFDVACCSSYSARALRACTARAFKASGVDRSRIAMRRSGSRP